MAFEANNFYVAKKKILPVSEFNVDCNIDVEEDIASIFAVSSEIYVNNKEVLSGSVEYSGVIETCVVYMTTNNEVGSVHTACPFTSKKSTRTNGTPSESFAAKDFINSKF